MGWDYLARVPSLVSVQLLGQVEFVSISKIYKKARETAQCLGEVKLSEAHEYQIRAALLGSGWKLRKRDKHL